MFICQTLLVLTGLLTVGRSFHSGELVPLIACQAWQSDVAVNYSNINGWLAADFSSCITRLNCSKCYGKGVRCLRVVSFRALQEIHHGVNLRFWISFAAPTAIRDFQILGCCSWSSPLFDQPSHQFPGVAKRTLQQTQVHSKFSDSAIIRFVVQQIS